MRWLVCAITVVAMVVGCRGPSLTQGPEHEAVKNSAPATVKNACDDREAAEESADVELPEDVLGVYYMRAARGVSAANQKSRTVHYFRWEIDHEEDQDKKPSVRVTAWMALAPLASKEPEIPVKSEGGGDPCYDTENYPFKVDDVSWGNEEGDFMDAVFLSLSAPLREAKLRLGKENAGLLIRGSGIRAADLLMKRAGDNTVFLLKRWVAAGELTPENDAQSTLSAELKAFLDGCAEKGTSASSRPGAG